jgi:hypothetical protein
MMLHIVDYPDVAQRCHASRLNINRLQCSGELLCWFLPIDSKLVLQLEFLK